MNSYQVQDIRLMYEAVYNDELREKAEEYNNEVYDEDIVEETTEYFYDAELNEDADVFDYVLEYLVSEGYADTVQDAVSIMANMNGEDIDAILSETKLGYAAQKLAMKKSKEGKKKSAEVAGRLASRQIHDPESDLEKQKSRKVRQQQSRQRQSRERGDDRDHGSMSAAERNPSMR